MPGWETDAGNIKRAKVVEDDPSGTCLGIDRAQEAFARALVWCAFVLKDVEALLSEGLEKTFDARQRRRVRAVTRCRRITIGP